MKAHLALSPWPHTEVSNNLFFASKQKAYHLQRKCSEHTFQVNVSAKHKESAAQQQTQAYVLNRTPIKGQNSKPCDGIFGIVKRHISCWRGIPFPFLLPEQGFKLQLFQTWNKQKGCIITMPCVESL